MLPLLTDWTDCKVKIASSVDTNFEYKNCLNQIFCADLYKAIPKLCASAERPLLIKFCWHHKAAHIARSQILTFDLWMKSHSVDPFTWKLLRCTWLWVCLLCHTKRFSLNGWILKCDHLSTLLWCCYAIQGGSNFQVCRWNPKVWPFNIINSTTGKCCCLLCCTRWFYILNLWIKSSGMAVQRKAAEKYFLVVMTEDKSTEP